MKLISVIMLVLMMLTTLVSCRNGSQPSSSVISEGSSQNSGLQSKEESYRPYPLGVPNEVLEKDLKEYKNLIHSLDARDISKLEIRSGVDYNTDEILILPITDADTIADWVTLLKKMELSARSRNIAGGFYCHLDAYINGKECYLGSFAGSFIYGESKQTMFDIDNYDELRSEFVRLEKLAGFPHV